MTVYFLCYKIVRQQFVAAQNKFLLVQNFTKIIPSVLLGIFESCNAGAAIVFVAANIFGLLAWVQFLQQRL